MRSLFEMWEGDRFLGCRGAIAFVDVRSAIAVWDVEGRSLLWM
ncbi:hypothetical protein [Sphaerospermopsis sp. FACHB-1094]|nr:hypothetical protein [Sphaerospermopsis sp. FACHB-1094]